MQNVRIHYQRQYYVIFYTYKISYVANKTLAVFIVKIESIYGSYTNVALCQKSRESPNS